MSIIKKSTKSFIFCFIVLTSLLITYTVSFTGEYSTPHTFQEGDVISADMINELFDYIRKAKASVTASDLVGTWIGRAFQMGSRSGIGWTLSQDGLFTYLKDISINFVNDGDGTYSLTTSSPDPFYSGQNTSITSPYEVIANTIFLYSQSTGCGPGASSPCIAGYYMYKISESRIVLHGANLLSGASWYTPIIILDKRDLSPTNPADLTASSSGLTVTLSWTDNSDDETGFKIIRRDSLEDEYNEIGTTAADTTSYADIVPAAGTYWYRVKAINDNGDSLGSNVVMMTVTE